MILFIFEHTFFFQAGLELVFRAPPIDSKWAAAMGLFDGGGGNVAWEK